MAIQLVSDLHLEAPTAYDAFDIEPKARYLALLGDVGNLAAHKRDYLLFLSRHLRRFRAVMYVPGNHEAYHSSWPETRAILRAYQEHTRGSTALGAFVLFDRCVLRMPESNTVILGCSLFSHIPPESRTAVSMGVNDFSQTAGWDVDAHNEAHKRDLSWLNAQVADLERSDVKIMIFTHWSPTQDVRAVDPAHARSGIVSAFSTDLSGEKCFRSSKVKLWAFGNTHYNCDFVAEREDGAGPLRLLANQRGYQFAQSEGFDIEKTVKV